MSAFNGDLLVGATSLQTYGTIVDFDGIFSEGPLRGANLTIPGLAGEVYVPKVRGAYDFTVPMVLRTPVGATSPDRADILAAVTSLRALLDSSTAALTLNRRRPAVGGTYTTQTCQGSYESGLEVALVGFTAARVAIVLRNLSGVWT